MIMQTSGKPEFTEENFYRVEFYSLPERTQLLYCYMNMVASDDGILDKDKLFTKVFPIVEGFPAANSVVPLADFAERLSELEYRGFISKSLDGEQFLLCEAEDGDVTEKFDIYFGASKAS